jgi:hypothetical protein
MQNFQVLTHYSVAEIQINRLFPSFFLKSSEPSTVSIDIGIPSWLSNHADAMASIHVWESISGGLVEMMDIPGNNFEGCGPLNVGPFHWRLIMLLLKLASI